jgi:Ca2+-binding EF-hand superfamily protein
MCDEQMFSRALQHHPLSYHGETQGYITKEDVTAFLLHNKAGGAVAFNMDCDVMKRYFGQDARGKLRVEAFSLFFISLQSEIVQQAFKRFTMDEGGRISAEDLVSLLSNYRGWRIPQVRRR